MITRDFGTKNHDGYWWLFLVAVDRRGIHARWNRVHVYIVEACGFGPADANGTTSSPNCGRRIMEMKWLDSIEKSKGPLFPIFILALYNYNTCITVSPLPTQYTKVNSYRSSIGNARFTFTLVPLMFTSAWSSQEPLAEAIKQHHVLPSYRKCLLKWV